jgi:hypothetical protein
MQPFATIKIIIIMKHKLVKKFETFIFLQCSVMGQNLSLLKSTGALRGSSRSDPRHRDQNGDNGSQIVVNLDTMDSRRVVDHVRVQYTLAHEQPVMRRCLQFLAQLLVLGSTVVTTTRSSLTSIRGLSPFQLPR